MKLVSILIFSILLSACADLPEGVAPVSDFELDRYLGKWYEIARLDHRFERGLEQVSAHYSMADDGSVRVANRGFSPEKNEWQDAVGRARFVSSSTLGHLEVSFFGPFYGTYLIFELDRANYQYAFVTGGKNYLWLLSRTPQVDDNLKKKFLNITQELGYNSDELIFVHQN